jgi:hypothetical protein
MSGGWMSESLNVLTGMPIDQLYHSSTTESELFKKLTEWDKKNYVITAAVSHSASNT